MEQKLIFSGVRFYAGMYVYRRRYENNTLEEYPITTEDNKNDFEYKLFKASNHILPEYFLKDLYSDSGTYIDPLYIEINSKAGTACLKYPLPGPEEPKQQSWKDIFESGELNEGYLLNNPDNLSQMQYAIKYLEENYYPPKRKKP